MHSISPISNRSACPQSFQLLYMCYTLFKLIIILMLISSVSRCSPTLDLFLLLYCAAESYELLFMFLLTIRRYCLSVTTTSLFTSLAQASYECFRLIIIIAMTAELFKNSHCVTNIQGALSVFIVCLGYVKYIFLLFYFVFYCAYLRNQRSIIDDERLAYIEEYLRTRVTDEGLEDTCSICMEIQMISPVVQLGCGHLFHLDCIKDWIRIKGACPMCRQVVHFNNH